MSTAEILEELPKLPPEGLTKIFESIRQLRLMPGGPSDGDASQMALQTVYEQSKEENWDGYGALPVTLETFDNARRLLKELAGLPAPEISAEPDGEISMEWYAAPRRVFSVSVGPDERLAFAGLDQTGEWHGAETFGGEGVPGLILEGIERFAER